MSDEESDDIEGFKLSDAQKTTKPLSIAVFRVLNKLEHDSSYFPSGTRSKEEEETQREKLRYYFHAAFYDRSRYYLPLFFGIIVLAVYDSVTGIFGLDLQAYGLMMDAAGAVIIALGLFRGHSAVKRDTPARSTGAQLGGQVYWNADALSATVRDTINGVYGTFFLFIGFTIQFIAISDILA